MKRFDLVLVGALASAILLSGCDRHDDWTAQRDTAICVDHQGNRVPDSDCQQTAYAGGGHVSPFLWYYLGRSSTIPYYGERAYGGSWTRTSGATYFHAPVDTAVTRSAAVSRGGLGATARAFGSFGE